MLSVTDIILLVVVVIFVVGGATYILFSKNGKAGKSANKTAASVQMQLNAYERLALLADRIALPNLISRVNQNGISAREMQALLTESIRNEFNHNITQQIYVSPDAWNALKNLKEQNLLIINQLANQLPPNASGLDLNKKLLEYLISDKKGSLHEVVAEILSYEAKKLM